METYILRGVPLIHEVLRETEMLVRDITASSYLTSDHYTNYLNLEGRLPEEKSRLLDEIRSALQRDEKTFRPFFIGTEQFERLKFM